MELGPALSPCSQGPQVAQLTGLQQDLGHLCGSNLHRLWESLGQLGVGTGLFAWPLWVPLLSMAALVTFFPVACGQTTWQVFYSKNLSPGTPDLEDLCQHLFFPRASLELCSALLWGISLGRPAC